MSKRSPEDVSVEIEGVTYRAGKATGKVVRKVFKLGNELPPSDLVVRKIERLMKDEEGSHDDEVVKLRNELSENTDKSLTVQYKQAALLLVDGEGKHPNPDKLEDELEIGDLRLLMEKINPPEEVPNSAAAA